MHPYLTGRKELIFNLLVLLRNDQSRILNLHGATGIGKTRVALELAHYITERDYFDDGVFYFDMKKMSESN